MIKIILVLIIGMSIAYAEVKKEFYKTGELRAEETVNEKGQRDGKTTYYYKSGKVRSIRNYIDGTRFGADKGYYETGEIKSDFLLTDKGLSGKSFYKNGKIQGKLVTLDNGNTYGTSYTIDGLLIAERTRNKKREKISEKEYYTNGKFKKITNNNFIKKFYQTGVLKYEETLKNGEYTGTKKKYYENAQLKEDQYTTKDIINKCYNHILKEYTENGVLLSKTIETTGCKTPPLFLKQDYYATGTLKLEQNYGIGMAPYMNAKGYYSNGKLEYETYYKNQKLDGIQKSYKENGNMSAWRYYNNGTNYKTDLYTNNKKWITLFYANGRIERGANYNNGQEQVMTRNRIIELNKIYGL